jgi:hypothetical protein
LHSENLDAADEIFMTDLHAQSEEAFPHAVLEAGLQRCGDGRRRRARRI